jgi:hypothetical protein
MVTLGGIMRRRLTILFGLAALLTSVLVGQSPARADAGTESAECSAYADYAALGLSPGCSVTLACPNTAGICEAFGYVHVSGVGLANGVVSIEASGPAARCADLNQCYAGPTRTGNLIRPGQTRQIQCTPGGSVILFVTTTCTGVMHSSS